MRRTLKQWWCGLRVHPFLHVRVVSGDGNGPYIEHYCPRCDQVLLRQRMSVSAQHPDNVKYETFRPGELP